MRDFKTLKVWQKAHELTLEIYRYTSGFPEIEAYGLTSQMRRASASVPANIAEGCGRTSDADLARFVVIASGSASELEYHCLLARDLGYLSDVEHDHLNRNIVEVKRMLAGFLQALR